jgi:hypothetical protein
MTSVLFPLPLDTLSGSFHTERMGRRSSIGIVVLVLVAACTSGSATKDSEHSPSATPASLLDTDGYSLLCGGAACDVPSGGVPTTLWNPLHLPTLGPGEACPVSAARRVSRSFGPAVGTGPVFAVGLGSKTIFPFEYPSNKQSIFYGSGWGGDKVLWIGSPSYTGPVLIRGEQLNGSHAVGFSLGDGPAAYTNLQFPPGKPRSDHGWRNWPTETRLQASGCYAYQVDGTTFSEVIVFIARAVATAS